MHTPCHSPAPALGRRALDLRPSGDGVVATMELHMASIYEANFCGWEIFHLDSLDDTECPAMVASVLDAEPEELEDQVSEDELRRDLWTAVSRLPPSQALRSLAEAWAHPGAAFYLEVPLQRRCAALWQLLQEPRFEAVLTQLRKIRCRVLQGVSLKQEAIAASKEIVGMEVDHRPLLCLQTTVRNRCAEKVVSALAGALHVLCDQGGLKVLVEHGSDAVESTATYLRLRGALPSSSLTAPRPLMPPMGEPVLPCFPRLFDCLQECFLDTRAVLEDGEDQNTLLEKFSEAWSKKSFFELSQQVASGPLLPTYCAYAASRLSLPAVAAELLQTWARSGLANLHTCAWCHRSMLAALSFLYQDNIPQAVLQNLSSGADASAQKLAESALTLLEKQLHALMSLSNQMADLDSWHHSFQAARSLLRSRLSLTPVLYRKLADLAFFSDLLPCLSHSEGLELLKDLASGLGTSREERRRCLRGLARNGRNGPSAPARLCLQRFLEDTLWSLRCSNEDADGLAFVLDIVDSNGIFKDCYDLITPAFGVSALEGVLELAHRTKQESKLSQEFCKRVDVEDFQGLPCSAWMEWQGEGRSSLPHLLYFALRSPEGLQLLNLEKPVEQRQREAQRFHAPCNAYAAARRAAQRHLLLSAAAARAAAGESAREGQVLLQLMGAWEEEELLYFLDGLVRFAGSKAGAAKALRRLGDLPPAVLAWEAALANAEVAGGPGENPWEDLPITGMPGFESERLRRQREDREQERLDQMHAAQNARCCPHCGRIIEKNAGCDVMTCGNHAHQGLIHGEGCGRDFSWLQSQPYRPTVSEARQPAGYSAILSWLTRENFSVCVQTAEEALGGLCPEDRRYAFANAAACGLLKRGRSQPALARALQSDAALQRALGFEPRLARVAAVLCDTSAVQSSSLAAAVLLGRDGWDGVVSGEGGDSNLKLRNAVVNLLVAVLGSPDNNHLSMLLLEPLAMMNTFPVGFCFGAMPGPEGYHFDCGCILDAAGCARKTRPPLENRHLHFVNFCSWAILSVGLLVQPENCTNIERVLTMRHMGEVDPAGRNGPENARTYSMNFALRCFECVGTKQGLSEEDRGLCFARLFHNFRRAAVSASGFQPARSFPAAEPRQQYEGLWRRLVDEAVGGIDAWHQEALRTSQAQEQLRQFHAFRARRTYLHHHFDSCKLALPAVPELSFVTALINRQEELAHLPLLREIVVVQNWIFDRLNGVLPESCLDQPVLQLMMKRQKKDQDVGSMGDVRHCELAIASFKRFVQGWRKFHAENGGQIPIECQAARVRAGLEAQHTRLEAIEDEQKIPLRFFVHGDAQCQPQMVAKHLCSAWNELVDSAVSALRSHGQYSARWASRMEREAPVWLADLFFQEQLVESLQSRPLQRSVLRQLQGSQGQVPKVDWPAVQQDILSSAWVHRVQRLRFPEAVSSFALRPEGQVAEALDEHTEERILEAVAQLPLQDLQGCREVLRRVALQLGSADPLRMVLELEEVQSMDLLPQAVQLLTGIRTGALPRLIQILDEENGEFSRFSGVLAVPVAPALAEQLAALLAPKWDAMGQAQLASKDAQLREAMANLEEENFCNFLMSRDELPLHSSYEMVYGEGLLSGLPADVLGCNLVAVLQQLRLLMREVRARKSVLDEGTVWDCRQGLAALAAQVPDEGPEPEDLWWEGPELEPDLSEEMQPLEEADPASHVTAAPCHPEAVQEASWRSAAKIPFQEVLSWAFKAYRRCTSAIPSIKNAMEAARAATPVQSERPARAASHSQQPAKIATQYLAVQKPTTLTSAQFITEAQTVRRLEKDEVLEIFETSNCMGSERVRVRCLRDNREGWATVKGNKGTIFLVPPEASHSQQPAKIATQYLAVQKPTTLTSAQDITEAQTVRRLEKDEVLEIFETSNCMGSERVRVRCLRDNREGWATVKGNKGTIFLVPPEADGEAPGSPGSWQVVEEKEVDDREEEEDDEDSV
ncbi:unnamed protein product [Effrenium voratum]|nr:unnamed protein product [Effrenium voratum]